MREILFRGKKKEMGEWIEGSLVLDKIKGLEACIRDFGREYHFVDPETVGQYIGRTDKTGRKIFEGDIVRLYWQDEDDNEPSEEIFKVCYSNENVAFIRESRSSKGMIICGEMQSQASLNEYNAEIIGNVWDNLDYNFDKTKGAGVR